MHDHAVLIGVDWGTTSLRAYLIGKDGMVLDSIHATKGILCVGKNKFESVFEDLLTDWLTEYSSLPIILSGMITSRNGWIETDYIEVPAKISTMASSLVAKQATRGHQLYFVSGLSVMQADKAPDVMRGEETELIGHMCHKGTDGVFIFPGTHSKWVWVKDREIREFKTFMTGEVYALLKQHSILGKLMESNGKSEAAFEKGVSWRLSQTGSILHLLFSVRTFPLFDLMEPDQVSEYLSGLLIAEEISAVVSYAQTIKSVTVIGRGDLAIRYCRALELMNIRAKIAPQAMVARGHYELALKGRLIK